MVFLHRDGAVFFQTLLGGATTHYHATGGFFGLDLAKYLPYNLTRTWHLQLALFFIVASFLAAGIFLAPVITGKEPWGRGSFPSRSLALVVVVVGSLIGEALSYKGLLQGDARPFFGAQGLGLSTSEGSGSCCSSWVWCFGSSSSSAGFGNK